MTKKIFGYLIITIIIFQPGSTLQVTHSLGNDNTHITFHLTAEETTVTNDVFLMLVDTDLNGNIKNHFSAILKPTSLVYDFIIYETPQTTSKRNIAFVPALQDYDYIIFVLNAPSHHYQDMRIQFKLNDYTSNYNSLAVRDSRPFEFGDSSSNDLIWAIFHIDFLKQEYPNIPRFGLARGKTASLSTITNTTEFYYDPDYSKGFNDVANYLDRLLYEDFDYLEYFYAYADFPYSYYRMY